MNFSKARILYRKMKSLHLAMYFISPK